MRAELVSADSIPVPCILAVGYSDDPLVTRYGPSRRNQYIIHYVVSGEGYFNGRSVKSGEGFLITPELDVEEYHSNPENSWSFIWVISVDDAMEHYFDLHNADKDSGIFKFHDEYVLENVALELGQMGTRVSNSALLAELFLKIFNSSVMSEGQSVNGVLQYFDFSVGYIKANLHLPITVAELCAMLGVSQPYLYKVFVERSGMSPKKYISECRISEAKRLLRESTLAIGDVAAAVGFSDALAFSRFFSKNVGCPPRDFRKSSSK